MSIEITEKPSIIIITRLSTFEDSLKEVFENNLKRTWFMKNFIVQYLMIIVRMGGCLTKLSYLSEKREEILSFLLNET